jgi:predicted methyltransferase
MDSKCVKEVDAPRYRIIGTTKDGKDVDFEVCNPYTIKVWNSKVYRVNGDELELIREFRKGRAI